MKTLKNAEPLTKDELKEWGKDISEGTASFEGTVIDCLNHSRKILVITDPSIREEELQFVHDLIEGTNMACAMRKAREDKEKLDRKIDAYDAAWSKLVVNDDN